MPVGVELPRTEPVASRVPGRSRRWLPIVFLVALTVGVLLPYPLVRQPHDDGEVRLPDRIEGYSVVTGNASSEPPGRSVIAFESGNGGSQLLALGVDGRTYRSVEPAEGILSPDGT